MKYVLILYLWGVPPLVLDFPLKAQCDNAIVQMTNAMVQSGGRAAHVIAACVPSGVGRE